MNILEIEIFENNFLKTGSKKKLKSLTSLFPSYGNISAE
jgi:hypothetical protein